MRLQDDEYHERRNRYCSTETKIELIELFKASVVFQSKAALEVINVLHTMLRKVHNRTRVYRPTKRILDVCPPNAISD